MQRWRNGIRADLRTSDRKVVWVAPVVGVHQRSQQVDCKSRGIKNPQKNNMQRWRNGIRAGFRYQWPQGCVGSNPILCTKNLLQVGILCFAQQCFALQPTLCGWRPSPLARQRSQVLTWLQIPSSAPNRPAWVFFIYLKPILWYNVNYGNK